MLAWGEFQLCKMFLQGSNMSKAPYITEAADMARFLTLRESRGPGDMDNAWERLEARYAIPRGIFWALRYRLPNKIAHDVYGRLQAACAAERAQAVAPNPNREAIEVIDVPDFPKKRRRAA